MRAEAGPHAPQEYAPQQGHQSGPDVGKALYAEEPHFRPAPEGLVQARKGDPLFDDLAWGYANGTYPYQKTIAGRSGPRVHVDGRELLMLSSYDYLGLVGHPHIQSAAMHALNTHGTSSGGVRLLTGTAAVHRDLDLALARFKGTEAAISFGSTYLTNLGVLSSLFGPRDVVFVDRLAHRSIIDACLLARVRLHSFAHGDASELRRLLKERAGGRRTLVIVEGVYSMDGDCCPLPEIVGAAKEHGAFVMVDEAHSFGILGATGRGVDEHFGMSPSDVDIWVGALSKAIPSNGGFVAGSRELVLYLQHRAGPFVFSSALNPTGGRRRSRVARGHPSGALANRRRPLECQAAPQRPRRTGLRLRGFEHSHRSVAGWRGAGGTRVGSAAPSSRRIGDAGGLSRRAAREVPTSPVRQCRSLRAGHPRGPRGFQGGGP